jgi:hypothetical protein
MRGFFRRKHDKRFPLSAGIGLATSLFAEPAPGWETPMHAIQRGSPEFAMQSLLRSWTGIALGGIGGQQTTYFNAFDTFNPFNFSEAPALKATLWSALAMQLTKRLFHINPVDKIPIVNKWIKWS